MPDAYVVLLRGERELARWPVAYDVVDLGTVDELARLRLGARRAGCTVELRGVSARLRELLDLTGLLDL